MDKINSGQMPPKKKPRPDAKEAFAVASWVAGRLHETELAAQGAGGRVPMRRMNRVEYANTVRDLFSLEDGFARRIEKELPADGKVGGFDRGAASLFMDEGQLDQYMAVADLVLDEGGFQRKAESSEISPGMRREGKYVHGIGVAYKDEAGKIMEDNPTPEFVATLKEPLEHDSDRGFPTVELEGKTLCAAWAVRLDHEEWRHRISLRRNNYAPGNFSTPLRWDWGR